MAEESLLVYLKTIEDTNNFAHSLTTFFAKRGYLTDKQRKAGLRMKAELEDKAEAAIQVAKEEDSGLDLSKLPAGRYAVPNGATRLKVLIRKPGKQSNWQDYIFVSNAAVYGSQQRYGTQAPDKNYSGRIQNQLKAIMADPKTASIEYGKLTGTCGVCGRTLEDENSVAAGIGPICAVKTGWDNNTITLEDL